MPCLTPADFRGEPETVRNGTDDCDAEYSRTNFEIGVTIPNQRSCLGPIYSYMFDAEEC